MTLLIRHSRIFEQIYYNNEPHFSDIVKVELAKVLPKFSILGFSPYILGDEGRRRRPDLALIDRNYSMWVVVEVELENHSLEHHVLPQVQTFATGHYDETHAELLHNKDPTLNITKLKNLIKYCPPVISVIVNSNSVLKKGWQILESDYSAYLTFLESFRAEDGDVVFSISGYLPTPQPCHLIKLRKHGLMNALVCNSPENVPADLVDVMQIYFDQRPYTWQIIRTKDTAVFLPTGGFTVSDDRNYEMLRIDEGNKTIYKLIKL